MFQESPAWAAVNRQPANLWTREEDKLFEQLLVKFSEELPDRWERIAWHLPGRSPGEVMVHYNDLVHDVLEIDSGRVELPSYADDDGSQKWDSANQISFGSKSKQNEPERKKGIPWTEREHRLFLQGLEKYGKGDWRSISRHFVVTRTPTQVASHAQKYFIRRDGGKKERKRHSIHDITTAENTSSAPADQNWVPPPPNQIQNALPVQQFKPPTHMPNQDGGSFGYQNFNFPM
ncbi:hypothetical protein UlMin_025200 [Ulmus minor]